MSEVSTAQKLMVVAQAFFRDGQYEKDYPHAEVSEQYEELKDLYERGDITEGFIDTAYRWNT